MRVLIGGVDYSAALDSVRPLEIERKLNEPSTCRMWLSLPGDGSLAAPARNESIAVTGDDGTVYFTGYLAVSPLPEYAGLGIAGPLYRLALEAVSDEYLLDTQLLPVSAGTTGQSAAAIVKGLVTKAGIAAGSAGALTTAGVTLNSAVSHFAAEPGAQWSVSAGQAAGQARGTYRAVNGALLLTMVGNTVHTLDESAGTLDLGNLTLTAAVERALANDVTVCGAEEPVAYVAEFFAGDGATLQFPLSETPYFGPAAQGKIIWDLFQEGSLNLQTWGATGNLEYFTITADGLSMNGGNGLDGQTALVWLDDVEAGGTMLLEALGVTLARGSQGTVAAVYAGLPAATPNCVAGFQVTAATGTGVVSVAPLVQGTAAGPSYALAEGTQYTMRVRLNCPEVERLTQAYRVAGDDGVMSWGGGGVIAKGRVQMEIEPVVNGVVGMSVVLYDGAVSYLPVAYTVCPASSLNLIGTMRSFFLKGLGTGWVSLAPNESSLGSAATQRIGAATDAAVCHVTRTGMLEFYTGNAAAAGSVVVAQYRTTGRAVGRAVNAASQAELQAAGSPAMAAWIGTVTQPAARSSLDCRNAATALVTAASSVSAVWSGTYKTTNVALKQAATTTSGVPGGSADVWPGDEVLLQASSVPVSGGSLDAQVVVRAVTLQYSASSPDVVRYAIAFSNDWANDLSVKTSKKVPADAWLPAAVSPTYLANLNELSVTGITASAVTVTANVTPPTGGGFEVRRRDFAFRAGMDVDLVIRSSVPTFDIPRATEADRFYIRMYDGNTPPNYSEFSAGVFVNLPLS